MNKKLELYRIDGWDRVVFNDDNGKQYVCVYPLWNPQHRDNLERYLCNLHTMTDEGEPDKPVDQTTFELYPYTWEGSTLYVNCME